VRVEFEGGGVLTAAGNMAIGDELVRSGLDACGRIPDGLRDALLREGVTTLADVASDVLELVAADLALLAAKVRAGVLLYDQVEGSVRRAMTG
jgi:hypothetical protein